MKKGFKKGDILLHQRLKKIAVVVDCKDGMDPTHDSLTVIYEDKYLYNWISDYFDKIGQIDSDLEKLLYDIE